MKKGKIGVLFVVSFASLSFVFITLSTNAVAASKSGSEDYYPKNAFKNMNKILRRTPPGYLLKKIYDPNTNQSRGAAK